VTTPKYDTYKQFINSNSAVHLHLCLPVFSWPEIQAVKQARFPNIDDKRMTAAFGRWGGLCRYVLDTNEDSTEQETLDAKIQAADLEKVLEAIGSPEAHASVSHRLLHIAVKPDMTRKHLEFASSYVARRCVAVFRQKQQQQLRTFIASSSGIAAEAAVRGQLFEGLSINVLSGGGSFDVRYLEGKDEGKEEKLNMPRLEELPFNSLSELNGDEKALAIPVSRSFCAIDCMWPSERVLFQMTVSLEHPESVQGIKDAVNAMATKGTVKLIFVVPPDIYAEFAKQDYRTQQKKKWKAALPADIKSVVQCVLCMPLMNDKM
jgi:hypothetical protein